MSRTKIPGVYMIRIVPENKVYIGQSRDIHHRFSYYRWGVTSDKSYRETQRPVCKAIRKYGLENTEFIILASGDAYKDTEIRLLTEMQFIQLYHATDPRYGYNVSDGMKRGHEEPREQSIVERAKRANPVYLYDMKKDHVLIFMFGTKGVGQYLGFGKDEMSHSLNRGLIVSKRYYIFHADHEKRQKIYDKLYKQRMKNSSELKRVRNRTANTFKQYNAALQRTLEIMGDDD